MTKKILQMVSASASERDIAIAARAQGILTMRQDGVVKALNGETSFEELSRVIDLEAEY